MGCLGGGRMSIAAKHQPYQSCSDGAPHEYQAESKQEAQALVTFQVPCMQAGIKNERTIARKFVYVCSHATLRDFGQTKCQMHQRF